MVERFRCRWRSTPKEGLATADGAAAAAAPRMSRFPPRPFAPTFISPHRSGWHRTKAIQKATGVTGCSYTTRLFEVVRDLMPPPRHHRRYLSRSLGGRDENGQLSGDRAPRMTTHLGVIARRFIWSVTDLQRFAIPARDSLSLRSLGMPGRGDPEQPAINERAGSGGSSVSAALVVTDAAYEGGPTPIVAMRPSEGPPRSGPYCRSPLLRKPPQRSNSNASAVAAPITAESR